MNLGSRSYCVEWQGTKLKSGYGIIWNKKTHKNIYVHRAIYIGIYGNIPKTLEIDHLCRNRGCINPNHFEIVSAKINTLRGIGPSAINARKIKCKHGHLFTLQNTRVSKDNRRACRTCHRTIYRNKGIL